MGLSDKKIIVVDDGEDMLEGLKIILEDEGFEVLAITDTENIKSKVAQFYPDLILLDYMMPNMDGGQVTEILKGDKNLCKIPIIMFSASQQIEKISLNAGADDFISKPFDIDSLIKKIRKFT